MSWRALLKGDPVPWLLERSDPAVRAQTLRSLLDKGPRDPDLREAQQRAMNAPPISTILRRQKTDAGTDVWDPKYEATHWTNLLLVEYGVDPGDPRVRHAARYVLEELSRPGRGGMDWVFNKDHGASCLIGSIVRYVAIAGYGNDERLEPLVQRLVALRLGICAAHLGPRGASRDRSHARSAAHAAARRRVPPLIQGRARPLSDRHGAELSLAAALVPALLSGRRPLRSPRARCGGSDRR